MQKLQGILQSQGRISKKLQFLPSSDSQFSAILDATRNKNVKVKSCTADVISQWELENKKKVKKLISHEVGILCTLPEYSY